MPWWAEPRRHTVVSLCKELDAENCNELDTENCNIAVTQQNIKNDHLRFLIQGLVPDLGSNT